PVSVADDLGPILELELPQLVTLWLVLMLVELRLYVGQEEVDRFLELAGEEILPLGVGAPGLIGRAVRRLAAVDEADQADDRVALLDPVLEFLADLLVCQVENRLVVDIIAAFTQSLAGKLAKASEVAGSGTDEDAFLAH